MPCDSPNASALDWLREPTATISASGSRARSRVKLAAMPPVPMTPKRTGESMRVMWHSVGGPLRHNGRRCSTAQHEDGGTMSRVVDGGAVPRVAFVVDSLANNGAVQVTLTLARR